MCFGVEWFNSWMNHNSLKRWIIQQVILRWIIPRNFFRWIIFLSFFYNIWKTRWIIQRNQNCWFIQPLNDSTKTTSVEWFHVFSVEWIHFSLFVESFSRCFIQQIKFRCITWKYLRLVAFAKTQQTIFHKSSNIFWVVENTFRWTMRKSPSFSVQSLSDQPPFESRNLSAQK